MVMEPGMLNDLSGEGQADWDAYVENQLNQAITDSGTTQLVADGDPSLESGIAVIDWAAFPVRIRECLQSILQTNRLLDWRFNDQPYGRLFGAHEEYLEWRTIRNAAGKIIRVEMTSELQEYWLRLAKHHPAKTLQILGEFARESSPAPFAEVYGNLNPFTSSPEERGAAFEQMMLPTDVNGTTQIISPYNNGTKAIAFMANSVNTLSAALFLAAFATFPYVKTLDGSTTPLTGREAIRFTNQAAQDCRDSDPTIVGSVINFAAQRRKIALLDPPGLYIANVASDALFLPDGATNVPQDWFRLSRGSKITDIESGRTLSLAQRLVFEVPSELDFVVGDLLDSATGGNIDNGAQIAAKVSIALYAKASAANTVTVPNQEISVTDIPNCSEEPACNRVQNIFNFYEQTQSTPAFFATNNIATRTGGE
ncbi:MAG: hypothetical protein AB4372_16420 [Xenococcus sp. (in: cyanobacteria)]